MNLELKDTFNSRRLLIFLPVILFILIRFIAGFNGLYGQDSHEYYRYSRAILNYFKTGNSPGDYFWPVYYPILGAIMGLVINNLLSLQLISILSLSGSLLLLYKILDQSFEKKNHITIYLIIVFFLSPYVFRNSVVVMSDMLTVFCITASFYFFIEYLKIGRLNQIILFSIFSLLAVLTRYAAAVIVFIPSVIILIEIVKKKKFTHLLTAVLITITVAIPHILIRKTNSTEFLGHVWLQRWSVLNFFRKDFVTPDGTEHFRLTNLINAFSNIYYPTYLVFGILLLPFLRKKFSKIKSWSVSLVVITVYALFLAGIPYQNQRFFLLSSPFVVILLFPAFQNAMSLFNNKKHLKYLILSLMVIAQLFFCIYFFSSAYNRNILEKKVAKFVNEDTHQNVYTFDVDVSFMSYGVNKNVINMWKERSDKFRNNSIVIFNEEKFQVQWAGMNPMLNWQKIKSNYHLNELRDFGNGWKAYEMR
jgi:Dolichyl-phosphate-mannose-protein mannosyltransferase